MTLQPAALSYIFTQFPVTNLLTFALTCKHWRLCTQREEYYQFLVETLQLQKRPDEASWQAFFNWKTSRNFIILLDISYSMALGPNELLLFYNPFHINPHGRNAMFSDAVKKAKELVADCLPRSRRGVELLLFDKKITHKSIQSIQDLDFLSQISLTNTTDIAKAVRSAFDLHKKQDHFPKATTTEIHLISDFDFKDSHLRKEIRNSNLEGQPQILFRCHNLSQRTEKTVKNLKLFQKKRSAKNRWHVSITFPENKGAKRQCRENLNLQRGQL